MDICFCTDRSRGMNELLSYIIRITGIIMRITEFDGSTITATSSDRLLTSCPGIDQFSSAATDDIIIQNYRVTFKPSNMSTVMLHVTFFNLLKFLGKVVIHVHGVKQLL